MIYITFYQKQQENQHELDQHHVPIYALKILVSNTIFQAEDNLKKSTGT